MSKKEKLSLKGEMSSLNVIFRHETLVNIHFSVTQCKANYKVLLLFSALSFCLSCYVNIFMFMISCSSSSVHNKSPPICFEFGCSSCFKVSVGNQLFLLINNKVFLFSPVTPGCLCFIWEL